MYRGIHSTHSLPFAALPKPIFSVEGIGDGVPVNADCGLDETVVLKPFVDDCSENFELVR